VRVDVNPAGLSVSCEGIGGWSDGLELMRLLEEVLGWILRGGERVRRWVMGIEGVLVTLIGTFFLLLSLVQLTLPSLRRKCVRLPRATPPSLGWGRLP